MHFEAIKVVLSTRPRVDSVPFEEGSVSRAFPPFAGRVFSASNDKKPMEHLRSCRCTCLGYRNGSPARSGSDFSAREPRQGSPSRTVTALRGRRTGPNSVIRDGARYARRFGRLLCRGHVPEYFYYRTVLYVKRRFFRKKRAEKIFVERESNENLFVNNAYCIARLGYIRTIFLIRCLWIFFIDFLEIFSMLQV